MSENNKKISVIIPTKNRVQFTTEAVKSVLNQKLDKDYHLEIIVVDDGSDEPLKPILHREFGDKVIVIRNKTSKGPGGSRNVGLKLAKGDYIAFLDSDDKWKPTFLSQSIKFLEKYDIAATVCLTGPYFDGHFPFIKKLKIIFLNVARTTALVLSALLNQKRLPKSAFYLCQISHVLFKKEYIGNNKFNEKAAAAEDWEFNVAITKTKNFGVITKKLVDFRYEVKSNTFTPFVQAKKEEAYKNLFRKLPNSHKGNPFYPLFKIYLKYFLLK